MKQLAVSNFKGMKLDADFVRSLTDSGYRVLSERTISMCLALLNFQFWPTRWDNLRADDDFKSWVSRAQYELMHNVNCGGTPVVSNPGCVPIGSPFMLFVSTAPDGALPMDGTARLQADYPDLMPKIPSGWKSGLYFTLPDMSGRTIVGAGFTFKNYAGTPYTVGVGSWAGQVEHTLTVEEMPSHNHVENFRTTLSGSPAMQAVATGSGDSPSANYTGYTGGGAAHNNMPPFLAGYWFIQAGNCTSEATGNFDIRLSGCLLEYTIDGETWIAVSGWSDYGGCLDIPLPFDLRFNNCQLEYSRDSAQTWTVVPGWEITETCFAGGWSAADFNMRVEGGILQYTEDGGDTWNNVFGWNTLQDDFLRERDRCEGAYGFSAMFENLVSEIVSLLVEYHPSFPGDFYDGVNDWLTANPSFWGIGLGQLSGVLADIFADMTPEELAGQVTDVEIKTVADIIYTFSVDGRWCDENITNLKNYLICEYTTPTTTAWTDLLTDFVNAIFDNPDEGRAIMARLRDYGTCENCNVLVEVEVCNSEPAPYECRTDFESEMLPWEITYSEGAAISYDQYGAKFSFTGSGHVVNIMTPCPDGATHLSFGGRAHWTSGATSATFETFAKVAGSWVRLDVETIFTSDNSVVLGPSAIPSGATDLFLSIILNGSTTGDLWATYATITGEALESPC